jgi:signal transduction histidine kinase/ligand-binding sensor domain-containing protein
MLPMQSPPRARYRLFLACFLASLVFSLSPCLAHERLMRRFSLEQGLPFSEVFGLAQDTRGFLWIGTAGGLFRYDGAEMRPWPRTSFRPFVTAVAAGPGGSVVTRDYQGRLLEVRGDDLIPLPGPPVSSPGRIECPLFDAAGNLWVEAAGAVWIRSPAGSWHSIPPERLEGEEARCLRPGGGEGSLIITDRGLWESDASGKARRLLSIGGILLALPGPGGSVTILREGGVVEEIAAGRRRSLFRIAWRPIDMIRLGGTLWVSYDNGLVGLHEGRPPEILGPDRGVPSGGPLLVDREGSLWAGTFRGLVQFPSPETVAWSGSDGLAATGPRRLAVTPEGIWVDSWGGLILMRPSEGSWAPERIPGSGTGAICSGRNGALWTGSRGRFFMHRGGKSRELPWPGLREVHSCHAGKDGRVWMGTNDGLFLAAGDDPGGAPPRRLLPPPGEEPGEARPHVLEDSAGRVWVSEGETICSADSEKVASGGRADWSCGPAGGCGEIYSLLQAPSGDIWAATLRCGVARLRPGGAWESIPGSKGLPGQTVRALRHSAAGGVWIISYGTILRVEERKDSRDGWEIVERPSPWQGLMISDAEDILEEKGDLWIATLAGLVRIPAEVRRSVPPVPPVELVEVLADGEPVDWRKGVSLPYHRSRIELRFAGLSFRDPGLLRYQLRLREGAPWREASGRPSFQLLDLPPGSYHPEVRASLDGSRWSPAAAGVRFRVLPPFWRTGWFLSLAAMVLASAIYAFYRYRLSHLLRLERVRTRIAADLHDDIGASLSRIALQSEILRRGGPGRPPAADRLLAEMGESAREVVDSMSDIVWSIDPRRDDLASLVARAREFSLGVLEPKGIVLDFQAPPGAAQIRLPPERRRHLYLILKETVNNAARHAGARRVGIVLEQAGDRLRLEVRDDGRGFTAPADALPPSRPRGGHGLPNMKFRAEQMGGTLSVRSAPGEGTVLTLELPLGRSGA